MQLHEGYRVGIFIPPKVGNFTPPVTTSSPLSFPLPTEVGFICFQFSLQNIICLGKFFNENPAGDIIGSQCGFVAQVNLLGGLPG